MWYFDFILLVSVSCVLAVKNFYLGVLTFILGLFVGFQMQRTKRLIGDGMEKAPTSRMIKAGVLSLVFGAALSPLLLSSVHADQFEKAFKIEVLLPVIVVIGLLSAQLMAALSTEKRKR